VDLHSRLEALNRFTGKPPAFRGLPSQMCSPVLTAGLVAVSPQTALNRLLLGLAREPDAMRHIHRPKNNPLGTEPPPPIGGSQRAWILTGITCQTSVSQTVRFCAGSEVRIDWKACRPEEQAVMEQKKTATTRCRRNRRARHLTIPQRTNTNLSLRDWRNQATDVCLENWTSV
jgi:hypothetical protein